MPERWAQDASGAIREAIGKDFALQSIRRCGGGCINDAFLLRGPDEDFFVKINDASATPMFRAEAAGLEAIAATQAIRVPRVVAQGESGGQAFLALEAIRFSSASANWENMGRQLAALHAATHDRFGWTEDNFIGSAPQRNAWTPNWAGFFRDQRMRPQFETARRQGGPIQDDDALLEAIPTILRDHDPAPSLLHGDLWSGNAAFDDEGQPVIFDPACYFGDPEADLAFTEMFGGFPPAFYRAYHEASPIPPGYERRKRLYNLYHIVNHANLFGGGYAAQAESVIADLLRKAE